MERRATAAKTSGCETSVVSHDPRRREPEPGPLELSTPRPAGLPRPEPAPSPPGPARSVTTVLTDGARLAGRAARGGYRRMSPRQRLVALAAIVAVIVLGPLLYPVVQRVAYAPEEPVSELVDAFNDGDVARAAELSGCGSRLCQPGALREGYRRPTDLAVVDVSVTGDSGAVRVRYRLGGERHESPILVERDAGIGLRGWSIVGGATGYLDVVSATAKSARVAGTTVTTIPAARTGGGRTGATEALLGVYTVTAADDPLYASEPATVAVTGEARGSRVTPVALTLTVKPAVLAEVERQIREFLDGCARVAEFAPRRCPFAHQKVIYRPADPKWTVDDYPRIEVREADRLSAGNAPLSVRTVAPGHATISYTSDGVPQSATVEITVRGGVTVDGTGKVSWTG